MSVSGSVRHATIPDVYHSSGIRPKRPRNIPDCPSLESRAGCCRGISARSGPLPIAASSRPTNGKEFCLDLPGCRGYPPRRRFRVRLREDRTMTRRKYFELRHGVAYTRRVTWRGDGMALCKRFLGLLLCVSAVMLADASAADARTRRNSHRRTTRHAPAPPAWLESRSAIVLDSRTGEALFERQPDVHMYPASTT